MVFSTNHPLNRQVDHRCLQQIILQELLKQEFQSNPNNIYFNFFESELFGNILLEVCQDCSNMPALPQGVLYVRKMREHGHYDNGGDLLARMKAIKDRNEFKNMTEDKQTLDYNPVKYNEKLMKSIWGQYNRYSPHNIKTNVHEKDQQTSSLQQQIAVAGVAIADKFAMAYYSAKGWSFGEN